MRPSGAACRRRSCASVSWGSRQDYRIIDVGELHLSFNRLDLAADPGLTIFTYTAEPGSRSEEALKLLGSWAATVDPAESARATDQS
jgi:hypothetical protein